MQAQISTFVRLLGRDEKPAPAPAPPAAAVPPPPPAINSIARVNGKVVSLTVGCKELDQAVLAILHGQRQLRGNQAVAGTEIMAGLRNSGHNIERADYILKRHAVNGHVVVVGKRRQKRYRLTTDGIEKAQKIAQVLAASVPKEGKQ